MSEREASNFHQARRRNDYINIERKPHPKYWLMDTQNPWAIIIKNQVSTLLGKVIAPGAKTCQ